jgi:hypothetical protein
MPEYTELTSFLGALITSIGTLIYVLVRLHRNEGHTKRNGTSLRDLQDRIQTLEKQCAQLTRDLDGCERERVRLMRMLVGHNE